MKTFSNTYLDLANPKPSSLVLHDMVQGIARECRFANQCTRHCSVAEHSVLVSYLVENRTARTLALVHDMPEAYLRDMPLPYKSLIPDCKRYEDAMIDCVIEKFKIEYNEELWREVKSADTAAYNLERIIYFSDSSRVDKTKCTNIVKSFGWSPGLNQKKAIKLFYNRWEELGLSNDLGISKKPIAT